MENNTSNELNNLVDNLALEGSFAAGAATVFDSDPEDLDPVALALFGEKTTKGDQEQSTLADTTPGRCATLERSELC